MDILVPAVNAVVVAAAALAVMWVGKERTDALERRMDKGFEQVDKRFEQVDKQFDQMFALIGQLRSEMATMRSDITNIALQVRARPQPNAG
jgi:septal ring factor EnvC (AmiA/AmiB activator)